MSGTIQTGTMKLNGVTTDYNFPDPVGDIQTLTDMQVDGVQTDYYRGPAFGNIESTNLKLNGVSTPYYYPTTKGFGSSLPIPIELGAVAWYNFQDSSKLIGGAAPTTDVAGWKDSSKVTNVKVSGDIVTNGSFDTDTNWTKGAGWVISGGSATYSGPNGDDYLRQTNLSWTDGKPYILELDVLQNSGSGSNDIFFGTSNIVSQGNLAVGHHKIIGFKGGSSNTLFIQARDNETFEIDNVKVYELDPATVAYDISQSSSSAQPVFTQPNGPVVFDGSDRLVEDTGALTFTNNATFAFRIKSGTQSANSRILSCKSIFSASAGFHIAFPLPTATDTMHIRGSGNTLYDQTLTTDTTTESNIIITFSGTTCKVWQDGVLQGTGTIDTLSAGDVDLAVGSNGTASEFFTGDFHELSCYQRALTDSEVLQLNSWMDR